MLIDEDECFMEDLGAFDEFTVPYPEPFLVIPCDMSRAVATADAPPEIHEMIARAKAEHAAGLTRFA